ncbi:MBL fold metallo-hydrolase [Paenibacillus montanisoli]|uniref:MBL fold metallo-hydrolase n=2 Tax=Paenibacillus montanisoli TaxID=2081970 RepID=A0A328TYR7_9BACL|nr:MBL fold metallo-hydrolase [Paenibacillus montanisoli]
MNEWPGGIVQVKVPLPFSLKWVNSYLIPDENGYLLVDPGLHTADAVQAWDSALAAKSIRLGDIHTILLTHQHPDHYGLAGWFQERTDAPVYISERSYAYAQRLWGADQGADFARELTKLYAEHGMPQERLVEIGPHLTGFVEKVSPQPAVTFLEAGGSIDIGGTNWRMIDTPGHANGQLCFYEPVKKWMLCGDQVLPNITPNISVVPGEGHDQLQQFLDSLQELSGYEVELAFPGHRDPFTNFNERIGELAAHHERRLNQIEGMIQEGTHAGYTLCMRLFGERIAGNPHNLRFAMSETLAHLYHLERQGRISGTIRDGQARYTVTPGV